MTIIDTGQERRLSTKRMAGVAISAFIILGTFVASASAQERYRGGDRGGDHRGARVYAGRGGGYYRAPPVVYAPYYAPPPVVYGPTFGVVPGLNINIL